MFHPGHWAAAFINSLENEGADIEEGIKAFKIFASWVKALPGEIFGSLAAQKAEKLIRDGLAKTGTASPAHETAVRFLALMIKKNKINQIDSVVEEAEKLLNRKRGIVTAFVESALPVTEEFESSMKEALKKTTQAFRVNLTGRVNPELIGGYRLRIGDEIIDASVRSQLKRLEARLTVMHNGQANGGY